jgi:hypothetical protein
MRSITHSVHRQQNDLLGLTLQTPNSSSSDDGMKNSHTPLLEVPEEKIAACAVHVALLAGLHAGPATSRATAPGPKEMPIPMDRYLAEGLAERYALLGLGREGTGREGARYSGCLCGK